MMLWLILGVVWAAVLVPPILRSRREGRPSSSVVSFRAQLSTLERATPGSSLRLDTGSRGAVLSTPRIDVKRRRREVLVALLAATGVTFVMAVALGGPALMLFLGTAGACGAYIFALRQIHLRQLERRTKVRQLVPRTVGVLSAPVGRAASN